MVAAPSGEPCRFVVLGATGQIGFELVRELSPLGSVIAPTRHELDLRKLDDVDAFIRKVRPTFLVNAAAYTAVDRAESEASACAQLNTDLPRQLGMSAMAVQSQVIHLSTDYVFDGCGSQPYAEDATTNPINVYGRTKRDGELALIETGARAIVVRTSWIYGTRGQNFPLTILRKALERPELRIVSDQWGAPTWSRMVAGGIALLISRLRHEPDASGESSPIYHMTAGGRTTWYDFAVTLLSLAHGPERQVQLTPIQTSEYPTPAARPAYSVLSNEKVATRFGVRLPDWESQLRLAFADWPSTR